MTRPAQPPQARYTAAENRVICSIGGASYLVCTIERQVGDPVALAQVLASALNRIPTLAA